MLTESRTLTDTSNGSSRTHTTKSWLCRMPMAHRARTHALSRQMRMVRVPSGNEDAERVA